MEKQTELIEKISNNPWDNAYWFARMLIASDKYGSVGTDTKTMTEIATSIRLMLDNLKKNEPEQVALEALQINVNQLLLNRWKDTKKISAVKLLIESTLKKTFNT